MGETAIKVFFVFFNGRAIKKGGLRPCNLRKKNIFFRRPKIWRALSSRVQSLTAWPLKQNTASLSMPSNRMMGKQIQSFRGYTEHSRNPLLTKLNPCTRGRGSFWFISYVIYVCVIYYLIFCWLSSHVASNYFHRNHIIHLLNIIVVSKDDKIKRDLK